jgi:hypothetical protein
LELPVLQLNEDVREMVHLYDQRLGLAGRAKADLPHFAFAVAFEMDYLVTWNCAHIANGECGIGSLQSIGGHAGRDSGSTGRSRYMSRDPIVDEVRRAREKIWEACGGDLDKLLDQLQAAEAQDRDRLVSKKALGQTSRHSRCDPIRVDVSPDPQIG